MSEKTVSLDDFFKPSSAFQILRANSGLYLPRGRRQEVGKRVKLKAKKYLWFDTEDGVWTRVNDQLQIIEPLPGKDNPRLELRIVDSSTLYIRIFAKVKGFVVNDEKTLKGVMQFDSCSECDNGRNNNRMGLEYIENGRKAYMYPINTDRIHIHVPDAEIEHVEIDTHEDS